MTMCICIYRGAKLLLSAMDMPANCAARAALVSFINSTTNTNKWICLPSVRHVAGEGDDDWFGRSSAWSMRG
jgi:hypothetical protein